MPSAQCLVVTRVIWRKGMGGNGEIRKLAAHLDATHEQPAHGHSALGTNR